MFGEQLNKKQSLLRYQYVAPKLTAAVAPSAAPAATAASTTPPIATATTATATMAATSAVAALSAIAAASTLLSSVAVECACARQHTTEKVHVPIASYCPTSHARGASATTAITIIDMRHPLAVRSNLLDPTIEYSRKPTSGYKAGKNAKPTHTARNGCPKLLKASTECEDPLRTVT